MQVEEYVMSKRDERRLEAALSDPVIKKRLEQSLDEAYKTLHWRVQHGDYKLRPEDVPEYEKWLVRHPEFDAPRKHK